MLLSAIYIDVIWPGKSLMTRVTPTAVPVHVLVFFRGFTRLVRILRVVYRDGAELSVGRRSVF
jgi:hypothetical protein